LSLPWDKPLSDWMMPEVALRDIAVGPSRHLVKFVDADDRLNRPGESGDFLI
jgi:hypothetical protein